MPAKPKSLYGVHSGVAMTEKWIATLKEKTGRTLDEWLALVKKSSAKTETERRAWLKTAHGLGMNTASEIAEHAEPDGSEFASPKTYLAAAEKYVERMFEGPKAVLLPLYDELLRLGLAIGKDAKACPAAPWCRSIAITFSLKSSRPRSRVSISASRSARENPKAASSTPAAMPKRTASRTAFPSLR
jgi:hypothetical protein